MTPEIDVLTISHKLARTGPRHDDAQPREPDNTVRRAVLHRRVRSHL
jgi:hypothetical protein